MSHGKKREKILLTGGSGLVGRTLAPLLKARCEVTHFDMRDPGDGLPFIQGRLCDAKAVEAACRGKDVNHPRGRPSRLSCRNKESP